MAGVRQFIVEILGNADGAVTAFKKLAKEAKQSIDTVTNIGSKVGDAFDVVKKGALIATGGLVAVGGAAAAAVAAAAADEASQKSLEGQLIRSAAATTAQVQATEAFIEKAMMATGIADDELRPAFGNLVRATGDLEKSQRLFNLALDVSAATSSDLESVTLGLGRAATGQISALTRLGIPLDENAKKSKDFGAILKTLEGQFGGAAATAADTFSGRVKILRTSLGEVVEEIGFALLPVAEKLVAFFQNRIVPALKAAVDGFKEKGLTGALKYFLAALGPFGISVINTFEAITLGVITLGGQVQKLATAIALAGVVLNPKGAWDAYNKIVNLSANAAATAAIKFDDLRAGVYQAGQSLNLSGNQLSKFVDTTDRVGTKVLPKAKEATDEWNTSLDEVKNTGSAAKKVIDETKQNLEKYTSALKSSTSAQKSFDNARKSTLKARQDELKAGQDLASAQENFNRVVAGYGADSKEAKAAQRELAKAQRTVANAGFAVEEATFAVTDAEKRLAELRADPTSSAQAIRQAEIDLAQAKLSVADATDTEFEATNGLERAQVLLNEAVSGAIEGSDAYNQALKTLEDAKERQIDASDRATEAALREKEAFDDLREAIQKVADAAAKVPGAGVPSMPGLPALPTVPTPAPVTVPSDIRGGTGANIVINTGIGTNGLEAGRQIVEVLQSYTNINRDAIAALVRR